MYRRPPPTAYCLVKFVDASCFFLPSLRPFRAGWHQLLRRSAPEREQQYERTCARAERTRDERHERKRNDESNVPSPPSNNAYDCNNPYESNNAYNSNKPFDLRDSDTSHSLAARLHPTGAGAGHEAQPAHEARGRAGCEACAGAPSSVTSASFSSTSTTASTSTAATSAQRASASISPTSPISHPSTSTLSSGQRASTSPTAYTHIALSQRKEIARCKAEHDPIRMSQLYSNMSILLLNEAGFDSD
ncbi:hypothetical protein DFH09DRAFT_1435187 [Mycena vulgaris]|nr:hypothetical protein DFH09DRAFT_1435187 [Mycena vulgaris]